MCPRTDTRQAGLTLIELVVFIVIIAVGVAGITGVYNTVVRRSADPMARKQALAIAESLLLEIEQQAFTWCDPQDDNVTIAANAAGCSNPVDNQTILGPTPGEARGLAANPFDNVGDYAGYAAPATDILGFAAVAGYGVAVAIAPVGGTGSFAGIPADALLSITVTVVGAGQTVTLVGYRARYAPNAAG